MAQCEVCGHEDDKTFQLIYQGQSHTFDCFECAILAVAPKCKHCGCRIIGHAVEGDGQYFYCAHCASQEAHPDPSDRERDIPAPAALRQYARGLQRGIADADKIARTGSSTESVRNTPPAGAWNDTSAD
jgi:hypothetical protein